MNSGPPFRPSLLLPHHWPMWAMMGLWWLISQLPWPWLMVIGDRFGDLLRHAGGSRVRITRINLQVCFPHLDEIARERLLRENFRSVGRAFLEAGFTWWASRTRFSKRVTVSGIDVLERARQEGRGVLLTVSHITCLEVAARMLGEAWPHCHLLYKANGNAVFEWLSTRRRHRYMKSLLTHKKITPFLQAIRDGEVSVYMTDQDSRVKHSVFAPFFGVQACTLKTPMDFVRQTNALLVPCFFGRTADGKGYYLEIQPALTQFPGESDVEDARRINALTEANVLRHPEQYLWQHRRFKHRPEGEASIY